MMATMADKDVDGIIRALTHASALQGGRVVATQLDAARALPAEALAARWRELAPDLRVLVEPDPGAALDTAVSTGAGPVVVAGSLYLVGAVRGRLVHGAGP
jgi:dihydrofolate synthase/folylpolyglutamate synthase